MKGPSLHLLMFFIAFTSTGLPRDNVKFTGYNPGNGLYVILHQDISTPVDAVSVMYQAGSKNEKPDRTGFAQIFEHLMFEGSPDTDRGGYMKKVGNAYQFKQGLKQFGPKVCSDKNDNKTDTTLAAIPGELAARDIINHYIEAIGGRDSLAGVHDRITVMSGQIQGFDVTTTIFQKEPDLFKQEVNAGGITQEVIFNGTDGEMHAAGQTMKIEGNELEKLKYEASIHFLLNLDSLNIKLKLAGMEKVRDRDSYKIEMYFPSGTKWIQFYDQETGYKVKEIKNIITPQGTFTQEIIYDDYRTVDGIKYPFAIQQSIGSQTMEFRIDSIKINTGIPDSDFEL